MRRRARRIRHLATRASTAPPGAAWRGRPFAALLAGNVALALGPWAVRLADCGPVAAGFWRLALALPVLLGLALAGRQRLRFPGWGLRWAMIASGVLFAADLGSWHIGIAHTRLGNATLFGNSAVLILMVWGLIAARRAPYLGEMLAIAAALAGAAILLGRSVEISAGHLTGDLFSIAAGLFYSGYILLLQRARATEGGWALLAWATASGAPVLLAAAWLLGERIWPQHWLPLVALALGSQIIGQGLLVYALRHFSPLIIALALMIQPVISIIIGWLAFGERLTAWDVAGMVLLGSAMVLVRARERAATPAELESAPTG